MKRYIECAICRRPVEVDEAVYIRGDPELQSPMHPECAPVPVEAGPADRRQGAAGSVHGRATAADLGGPGADVNPDPGEGEARREGAADPVPSLLESFVGTLPCGSEICVDHWHIASRAGRIRCSREFDWPPTLRGTSEETKRVSAAANPAARNLASLDWKNHAEKYGHKMDMAVGGHCAVCLHNLVSALEAELVKMRKDKFETNCKIIEMAGRFDKAKARLKAHIRELEKAR